MLIVDSQVHIWGADTPERPWPKRAEAQRPIPLDKDDLLREMNEAGVDRVIIVPPSWEGDRNDLGIEAAPGPPVVTVRAGSVLGIKARACQYRPAARVSARCGGTSGHVGVVIKK